MLVDGQCAGGSAAAAGQGGQSAEAVCTLSSLFRSVCAARELRKHRSGGKPLHKQPLQQPAPIGRTQLTGRIQASTQARRSAPAASAGRRQQWGRGQGATLPGAALSIECNTCSAAQSRGPRRSWAPSHCRRRLPPPSCRRQALGAPFGSLQDGAG